MRSHARRAAFVFASLLFVGCSAGKRLCCDAADPSPTLPVVVHYVAERNAESDSAAQHLRFAAWSDGAIVTRHFDASHALTYHVGQVTPDAIAALLEELASFGVFDLAHDQFGIDHTTEEGVWVRCAADGVRLDGARFPTAVFASTPQDEAAYRAFLNARLQATLSITRFDDSLRADQFVPLSERVDASGAFRGFDPNKPNSYEWSWIKSEHWRIEPRHATSQN